MGWEALGRAVVDRRVELGYLTRQAFADASRLSVRTLGDIESARRTSYARDTLARLEQSLKWPAGKVDAILRESLPDERPPLIVHGPDEWSLAAMLIHSGLDQAAADRIVDYIKVRRAQQHQQLADEVYDLILEAGGRLPPRPRREKPLPREQLPNWAPQG